MLFIFLQSTPTSAVAIHPVMAIAAILTALGIGGLLVAWYNRKNTIKDREEDKADAVAAKISEAVGTVFGKSLEDRALVSADLWKEVNALRQDVKEARTIARDAEKCATELNNNYLKLEADFKILTARYDSLIIQYTILYRAYLILKERAGDGFIDFIEPTPPQALGLNRRATDPPVKPCSNE